MYCPKCGQEMRGERCGSCGYDRSRDCLQFPTVFIGRPAGAEWRPPGMPLERQREIYRAALNIETSAEKPELLESAAVLYEQLGDPGFLDSPERARRCREKARLLREEQSAGAQPAPEKPPEREPPERKPEKPPEQKLQEEKPGTRPGGKGKKKALIAAACVVLLGVLGIVLWKAVLPGLRGSADTESTSVSAGTSAPRQTRQPQTERTPKPSATSLPRITVTPDSAAAVGARISAGKGHTVGLLPDGTAAAAGNNDYGQCDVSGWRDITAVSAGNGHTVGLKTDGTVAAVGLNKNGQCDVSGWTDIVSVSAGGYHTAGLKADGTAAAAGNNDYGQCDVSAWRDITAISAGNAHTVGLKADGTVVAVGDNTFGQCRVSEWRNIIAVSAGDTHTLGLRADGTVLAAGSDSDECKVTGWRNIVAVYAGYGHSLGLKADGSVVAVGSTKFGQCTVYSWGNMMALSAGADFSVGLRSDGAVLAVGNNESGQLDVSSWAMGTFVIGADGLPAAVPTAVLQNTATASPAAYTAITESPIETAVSAPVPPLEGSSDPAAVESIRLGRDYTLYNIGDRCDMIATIYPPEADVVVTWTSEDPGVCTVDQNGLVTAVNYGTTTIRAAADGVSDSCIVRVYSHSSGNLSLSHCDVIIHSGSSETFTLKVHGAENGAVILYESDRADIVSVDSTGRVKAVKNGTASVIVTVKTEDGKETTLACAVQVIT